MEHPSSRSTVSRRDAALAVGLPWLLLLPFLGKAFHIDDPIYLRVAQHVLETPWNFYGFSMNWYGTLQPVYEINQNPPLLSYYLAPFGAVFGWSEWVMHAAMLLPAAAAIYGVYVLAGMLGAPARWATWFAVLNPLFFVSATTVMTDVPMLACWLWAVIFWLRGLDTGRAGYFAVGGVFIGAAFLFKYFGLSLLPLLAVYTLTKAPRRLWPLAYLLIPVGIVVAYELWCFRIYGQGQFLAAFSFADAYGGGAGKNYPLKVFSALAFLGGAGAWLLVAAPPVMRRWGYAVAGVVCLALGLLGALLLGDVLAQPLLGAGLAGLGGLLLLTAARALTPSPRPVQLLLGLWLGGTLVFVCFVNHFVNARVLLPALPVLAILLTTKRGPVSPLRGYSAVALSTLLALLVAVADTTLANAARRAAYDTFDTVAATAPEARLWFAGHWGFQWYMEAGGALPLDGQRPDLRPGDVVVTPENNTNLVRINDGLVIEKRAYNYALIPFVSTMSREMDAGFYSDVWGALPFAFGPVPPERYELLFLGIKPEATAR